VIELQERGEHRNALQAAPLFGRAGDYLEALATEMTRRGAVSLPEDDARAITVAVARDFVKRNQIAEVPQPAAVLAALSAHHVLECSDYLASLFAAAKVKNAHSHRFRDTFATGLLLAGVPIEDVSVLLGHSNTRITAKHYSPCSPTLTPSWPTSATSACKPTSIRPSGTMRLGHGFMMVTIYLTNRPAGRKVGCVRYPEQGSDLCSGKNGTFYWSECQLRKMTT